MFIAPLAHGSVISTFAAGTLTLTSDAGDAINVACTAGNVVVNAAAVAGPVACNGVVSLIVNGDALANTIVLSGVTAADFTQLTNRTVNAGDGIDTITGSNGVDVLNGGLGNDVITGAPGNDTFNGDDGDDQMIWNNGDNTDVFEGGIGTDTAIVNGAPSVATGDVFSITPNGTRVQFNRSNLVPFGIDIGSTENFQVNGGLGNDQIIAATGLNGLIALTLSGGDGNDTITGSNGIDVLNGGLGNDVITGAPGNDTFNGDDGDDQMIWNNGDNTDVFEGGIGTDTAIVNGAPSVATGDVFSITPNGTRVQFNRSNLVPFGIDIGSTENFQVNGGLGDDQIIAATGLSGLIALTLSGGDGNDTITGSNGVDVLNGGLGNDVITGAPGNDTFNGDDGDDQMIWNNGDNTDVFEGGIGTDTAIVNGAPSVATGDVFSITPNGARVQFNRSNLVPFGIDIGSTENFQVNGGLGDDQIIAATGLSGLIALTLSGGDGNDIITGSNGVDVLNGGLGNDVITGAPGNDTFNGDDGDDQMIWNNGDNTDVFEGGIGTDTAIVNGAANAATGDVFSITPNGARVQFNRSNLVPFGIDIGSTENFQVNGGLGDDQIIGSAGLNGLIAIVLRGGEGNDTLIGGDGADVLEGGPGNDTMDGGDNPAGTVDRLRGDANDDTLVWNPGRDDDEFVGGDGFDIAAISGGGAGEHFNIALIGNVVRLDRTNNAPAPFFVEMTEIERLNLLTAGGADRVITQLLPNTVQFFDGDAPITQPGDELRVLGLAGILPASPIQAPGFASIEHQNFEAAFLPQRATTFTAALDGAQEVPPVDSTGIGRGRVTLNAAGNEVTVNLTFSDLGGNNTMTHIHGPAAIGAEAGVLFDLGSSALTTGTLGPLTFALTPQQVADLKAGLWYFNVHSTSDAGGEIRGQILADRVIESFLTGDQNVPAAATSATGYGVVTLAGPEDEIRVELEYFGLGDTNTATQIRGPARRGQVGAVTRVLPTSNARFASIDEAAISITPVQAEQLKRGEWYFEVQSQTLTTGELRGQIDNVQFTSGFE